MKGKIYPIKQPLVVAHRGYCSLLPENTIPSIEAALYKSDLVEFDLLLTKDYQVIVFHDRYLSRLTNVADLLQYAQRKAKYPFEQGKQTQDWWINQFTLAELRGLEVKQGFEERPQMKGLTFKIPTFEQTMREVLEIKEKRLPLNQCGFLIEVKSIRDDKDEIWDSILVEKIVQIFKKLGLTSEQECKNKRFPIILQSFNHTILKLLSASLKLPIIHLLDQPALISQQSLEECSLPQSIGIGISQKHAIPQIKKCCESRGLLMLYWTLRDDQPKKIPFKKETYREAYLHLLQLGIDGFITEFPQLCQQYIDEHLKQ